MTATSAPRPLPPDGADETEVVRLRPLPLPPATVPPEVPAVPPAASDVPLPALVAQLKEKLVGLPREKCTPGPLPHSSVALAAPVHCTPSLDIKQCST